MAKGVIAPAVSSAAGIHFLYALPTPPDPLQIHSQKSARLMQVGERGMTKKGTSIEWGGGNIQCYTNKKTTQ